MKNFCLLINLFLISSFVLGCSKPDHVTTMKAPLEGVFYTVETSNGSGPADPDFTRVYVHLERNGKSDKKLVMDGGYLEISKITWANAHDATFCLENGVTNTFRNEVTLIVGDTPKDSETIHNHLHEHCDTTSMTSLNASN